MIYIDFSITSILVRPLLLVMVGIPPHTVTIFVMYAMLPCMDDDAALAALLDMPAPTGPTASELAAQGATVDEIASQLGLSQADAANQAGPITPAQLRRLEHVMVSRAVGMGDSLPHIQAGQFVLSNRDPSQWGRQAAGQGSATLRVIVDRTWQLRAQAGQVIEGETVPVLTQQE